LDDLREAGMLETQAKSIPFRVYRQLEPPCHPGSPIGESFGATVTCLNTDGTTTFYNADNDMQQAMVRVFPPFQDSKVDEEKEDLHQPLTHRNTVYEDDEQVFYDTYQQGEKFSRFMVRNKKTGIEKCLLFGTVPDDGDDGENMARVLTDRDPTLEFSTSNIIAQDKDLNFFLVNMATLQSVLWIQSKDIRAFENPILLRGHVLYLSELKGQPPQLLDFNIQTQQHQRLLPNFIPEIVNFGILEQREPLGSWVQFRDGFSSRIMRFEGLFSGKTAVLDESISLLQSYPTGEVTVHRDGPFSNVLFHPTESGRSYCFFSQRQHLINHCKIDPHVLDHLSFTVPFYIPNTRDGSLIPTIGFFPHGIQAGERIPALIHLHGGPEGFTDQTFSTYRDFLINRLKIALIALNVRGSSGFGTHHLQKARGKIGDVLDEVAESRNFVASLPFIDPSHIYLMGESWGGTLTGLVMTSPYGALFKGGMSASGIMDWEKQITQNALDRNELEATLWMERLGVPDPRVNPAVNASLSPALRLMDTQAPWLVLHGTADTTARIAQAECVKGWCVANPNQGRILVETIEGEDHSLSKHEPTVLRTFKLFLELGLQRNPITPLLSTYFGNFVRIKYLILHLLDDTDVEEASTQE
jgi:poly(3-hydroxybutyrate) depolymerase